MRKKLSARIAVEINILEANRMNKTKAKYFRFINLKG